MKTENHSVPGSETEAEDDGVEMRKGGYSRRGGHALPASTRDLPTIKGKAGGL